jgi:hypothetical protein
MLFYAVKLYKLRTAKAAKALMLVSVGYILLQLVYIIDKFLRVMEVTMTTDISQEREDHTN